MLQRPTKLIRQITSQASAEKVVKELFAEAGITVNGSAEHDITVHDERFYTRVLRDATLGMGESYMERWWDSPRLDETMSRLVKAELYKGIRTNWRRMAAALRAKVINPQAIRRAFEVGERHYDIGNDLYEAMLDSRMVYTCAYWKNADNLDDAQEAKLDLVCRKLGLEPGMRVLELGCGWGSFAKYAAEKYGVSVVGYTVSKEQVALGTERCEGLPVELRLADYREADGVFDRVVSIGILEHIGPANHRTYMEVVKRCLVPGGVTLIHTIGGNRTINYLDPWFEKYIFPGAVLPTMWQIGEAVDDLLNIEDVHNFGPDYDRTLMAWYHNFVDAWPELRRNYDDRFYRMWEYYLLTCAGGFRSRYTQLWQLVLTPWPGSRLPDCRHS